LEQLKQRSKMSSAQEAHFRARMDGIAANRTAAAAHNREVHALAKDRLDLTREARRRTANDVQAARTADAERIYATHGAAADEALSHIEAMPDDTYTDDLDF
jgi:acetoin utilization deacetylase AcuC-like enzyme